jgi:hypothetical protein
MKKYIYCLLLLSCSFSLFTIPQETKDRILNHDYYSAARNWWQNPAISLLVLSRYFSPDEIRQRIPNLEINFYGKEDASRKTAFLDALKHVLAHDNQPGAVFVRDLITQTDQEAQQQLSKFGGTDKTIYNAACAELFVNIAPLQAQGLSK